MRESTLKDLTLNITDGKHGDCQNQENSGYYFISCKDVYEGEIHYSDARQITPKDYEETHRRTKLEPNDILVTNSGTIGRMAFIKDRPLTYKTTFQKSVAIVKPDCTKVLPKYLYYQLKNCVAQFVNESNGSAQKNLLLSTMREFKIFVHEDIRTQQKLADILSTYDDMIENNKKQIKLLEEAVQRLYKEWFVDLHFPGWENTTIVDGVPEGWRNATVGDICKLRKETIKAYQIPSGLSYIGLEHMPRKDICLADWGSSESVTSNKFKYYENDILFGKIRPYFHKVGFALNNGIASTDAIIMTAHKELWGLLLSVVSSDAFVDCTYQNCKEGSKMPRADWNQMKVYPILIAESKIQRHFEAKISSMTQRIKTLAMQNHLLQEARDRLLPKLMSGELEV